MKYSIIGDICPARMLQLPESGFVSSDLTSHFSSRYVVANLEAPIANEVNEGLDHLVFQGRPEFLDHLDFVDAFSLANNHINDLGDDGMASTITSLKEYNIAHNGIFKDVYHPLSVGSVDFIFASDMMNLPFPEDSKFNYLYMYSDDLSETVRHAARSERFVVLYLHTGLLFCRLPSPVIRKRVHELIDLGADMVVTAHSHCFGAVEKYKDSIVCYNLGDFLMDGQSMRRRTSMILNFTLPNTSTKSGPPDYEIEFCQNRNYHVSKLKGLSSISSRIAFHWNSFLLKLPLGIYSVLFNIVYRLNLLSHVLSTLVFLVRKRGLSGAIRQLARRKDEVFRYFYWMRRDRRKTSTDYDAIEVNRKKITTKDLS